ncbi:hypothetical protein [Alloalcanivorax gelatiniphagus]|uniref:CHAD domain-containing protein n=3 Tax=Alloalcanivorax gelatiniphagus TaxID=1194167 RepID=A0ABY2XHV5_9GAMM|nr:hypothetical protein [Alloalcanivorax gelatiniphagus]TMW11338.1 hypothetical protein FGS76_14870 [Alloalcanivorax gelatiniphagus]|tara:strand:- start:8371 stop:8973 length:603 start_codon:yes stop_codon:yes gene_type:complete
MGSQVKWAGPRKRTCLAIEAVENRIVALTEYLLVYRAGAGSPGRGRHQRIRELRHDIARLRAWGQYLRGADHRPLWWRLLRRLGTWLGGARHARPGHRCARRAGVQRLSAYSVVDRAYAAQMEDCQGRLLTLGLAAGPWVADLRASRERLLAEVELLRDERRQLAEEAGRVAVVCWVLSRTARVRGWLGFSEGSSRIMDP